jgi:hypothetical protein
MVEVIHLFAQLNQDIDLGRLREVKKAGVALLNYSSEQFLIVLSIKCPNCEADTHEF